MSAPRQYRLKIDVFSVDSLPMGRLAEYMAELARLLGEQEHVHFSHLENGSAVLVSNIDELALPKVAERVQKVREGRAPKEAMQAFRTLDGLLAKDNAVAVLIPPDCTNVIEFPGRTRPKPVRGKLTPESVAATLSALLPEQAVVTDEAVTFGRGFFPFTYAAEPHDWLNSTGGAIGCGPPLATGAAVGAPGRRVVALQADGSAMYTLQALWTQARENLDVTTVLLSNRKYQILIGELANVGANPGRTALDMLDLGNPDLDWTKLAGGMGVEAARADSCERFADLFAQANARKGPFLIELVI